MTKNSFLWKLRGFASQIFGYESLPRGVFYISENWVKMIPKKCDYCNGLLVTRLNKTKFHQKCYYKSLKGEGNPFFGKKHSTTAITSMSELKKGNNYSLGKKRSAETRKKISDLAKLRTGEKNSFFGRRHSIKTKDKISSSKVGQLRGDANPSKRPEVREKIRNKMIGRKITWNSKISETKKLMFSAGELNVFNKGKPMSKEQKEKMSKTRIGKGLAKLEKNPMWKGGISYEPYPLNWNHDLRSNIRQKYNHLCFECGQEEITTDKRNGKRRILSVHHINYDKKDLNPTNLIPLCVKCHAKTNTKRNYWQNYFSTKLSQNQIKPLT